MFAKLRDRKRLLIPWLLMGAILLACAACLWRIGLSPKSTDLKIAQKIFGNDFRASCEDPDPLSCPQGLGPITDYCAQTSDLLKNWLPKRITVLQSDHPLVNPAAFFEIGRLEYLTELSLNGNQLTSLPPEIGQLKNLHPMIKFFECELCGL